MLDISHRGRRPLARSARAGTQIVTRAILHIGTEKTGSTSLQAFLARNRKWLRQNGFHYPKALGHANHTHLFGYAVNDPKLSFDATDTAGHASFRARVEAELASDVAANRDRIFLFSNEHCHSRLFQREELERLKALLDRSFDDIRVIVYLRRQDRLAVSLYSTLLKVGINPDDLLVSRPIPQMPPDAVEQRLYYDYRDLLARWSEVFGRENLLVRRFAPGCLIGDSIVADFCDAIGLAKPAAEPMRANESFGPEFQAYLRMINPHLQGEEGRIRSAIASRIADLGKGPGRLPSRDEALAFCRPFAEGNEAVRRAYFPLLDDLFDDDFADYPQADSGGAIGMESVGRISAALLRGLSADVLTLRADLLVARASVRRHEGEAAEALRLLGMALAVQPGHAEARELRACIHRSGGSSA